MVAWARWQCGKEPGLALRWALLRGQGLGPPPQGRGRGAEPAAWEGGALERRPRLGCAWGEAEDTRDHLQPDFSQLTRRLSLPPPHLPALLPEHPLSGSTGTTPLTASVRSVLPAAAQTPSFHAAVRRAWTPPAWRCGAASPADAASIGRTASHLLRRGRSGF